MILLRTAQAGIPLHDLEEITLGMLYDILSERQNDKVEWDEEATEEDINNF